MNTDSAPPVLIDSFQRRIDYLRVSVTDRCDLRCTYCLPKGFKGFEEPANWMTHAEMTRLVGLFVGLGVRKVRLTGGEPLLRRNLPDLAAALAALPGLHDLSLSSNGTQLAHHAAALRRAGVQRLNISLDTLDHDCFARITGRDCLADVLAGLRVAKEAGFAPIKLNMVVQPAVNDAEVERMVGFAIAHGFILRLIEAMPMGDTGRQAGAINLSRLGMQLAERHALLPAIKGSGAGPARYWTTADGTMSLGVITPMSQHFCATCNRVRLTVDGTLHLCLGQEDKVALGAMLRAGADDAQLRQAIIDAIAVKPERHDFSSQPAKIVRFMSQTGG
ncbi:cyclic pyranopterin phosphate synthase [Andreprevotia lacus DSM 23236]|jgi:cyclic pyranopterin phosphate synthase|uniref:GTP 3',8-cyclase n=1 Tax=Andreprevotia lacus DSM 23236 TaxID=1121001 RepID=A0A1W1XY15_9NEIS|nr:GTP 3',8-cyclase MoaA [Andreprevotia lacus]SMC28441.1 cyclic pyranopterin phosphate synthase [Andreprevotia lacus DSM 23236]